MNTPTFRHALVAALFVSGCAIAPGSTEDIASVDEAYRVDTAALACGTPDPTKGEDLNTSGVNAELQEWTDSLNAMSSSANKTDLLGRLLTTVQGPATAFPVLADQTAFLRGVRAPLPMTLPYGNQTSGIQVGLVAGWYYGRALCRSDALWGGAPRPDPARLDDLVVNAAFGVILGGHDNLLSAGQPQDHP